jgi:tetratricopeptide (TPR) repeat protein
MIVPREPESAGGPAFLLAPPPQPDADAALDIIAEASTLVDRAEDRRARDALGRLIADGLVRPVSATAERRLAALGENQAASPETRSLAWTIFARSREIHCDLADAQSALQRAIALSPAPDLLGRLVGLTYRRDGSIKALKLIDDGLDRWPAESSIKVLSAAIRVRPDRATETDELISQTLQVDPKNPDALAAKARLALFLDQPAVAIESARGAIPVHPSLGRALLAIALHKSGRMTEDPALMVSVLADPPADPWLLTRLADALHGLGRPAEALPLLDRAEELTPEDRTINRSRGYTNLVVGRYREAEFDFRRAAELETDPWLTAMRGETARMLGDAAAAVDFFGSIGQEQEPEWVATSAGAAFFTLGDLTHARAAFERALQRNPEDVDALCGLGEVEFERGERESNEPAEMLLRRAIEVRPDYAKAHALLAEFLRRTGRFDDAVASFEAALALSPDYSYALASKGQTLIEMGDRRAGSELMIEALRLAPNTTWIPDELYQCLMSGDPEPYESADAVLRDAQRVIRDSGGDRLPITTARARLARSHGRLTEAARLYRKVGELAPDDSALALESAVTLHESGRGAEALVVVDRTLKAHPADQGLTWKRIELLWELGRLSEARDELKLLAEYPEPRPAALAALGEIYRLEGRRDRARRLLDAALQRQPDDPNTLASLGALDLDGGDVPSARARLRRAAALHPGYGFALNMLVRLELDAGRDDEVRSMIGALRDPDPADRELTAARTVALYGLGDYEGAIELIDDALVASGDDPNLLRTRGWAYIGLAEPRLASKSFRAAAALPDTDASIVDVVVSLTRVGLWSDARRRARAASTGGNPFAHTALAVLWLRAGRWDQAHREALIGERQAPPNRTSTLYALRSLRRHGEAEQALQRALAAADRWPHDQAIQSELAESLAATGDCEGARRAFEDLLRSVRRQSYRDADHFAEEGRCLLNLGRHHQAVQPLLRALTATDQPAPVLFDLIRASLLDGDIAQAAALEERANRELDRLSAPIRNGLMAAEIQVLTAAVPRLGSAEGAEAERIAMDLEFRQDRLRAELDELSADG